VDGFSQQLIARSGYEGEDFTAAYDAHRPAPPDAVLDIIEMHAVRRSQLVVDLGAGTGLSTRPWADRSVAVVGIDANKHMVERARAETAAPNVSFALRHATDTGLSDGEADIVTCAQSFHWMEPQPVLAEAARILRAGGVFAAYDYDVVPVVHPSVDAAFVAHVEARSEARRRLGLEAGAAVWPKHGHAAQLRSSGSFSLVRELQCHAEGMIDAERLIGLASSIGGPAELFDGRALEVLRTFETLASTARAVLGEATRRSLTGYTVRLGVRR
jgi:SAM-dependent methyltransferase